MPFVRLTFDDGKDHISTVNKDAQLKYTFLLLSLANQQKNLSANNCFQFLLLGGGGCLTQEKIVAEAAKIFVVIADERKKVEHLGTTFKYVPIEVLPMAYKPIQQKIQVILHYTYSVAELVTQVV